MERYLKLFAMVIAIAVTSAAVLSFGDPIKKLAFPQGQSFVPMERDDTAEPPGGKASPAGALTSSRRPRGQSRDNGTIMPDPGAEVLGIIDRQREEGDRGTFPVLLPHGFGASAQSVAAARLRVRVLDNGYYAVFRSAHMEITIVGTRMVWHEPGAALAQGSNHYIRAFEDPGPIPAGGAIGFGHFGADYQVTFDCIDTSPELGRNCIQDVRARAFVEHLIAGTPTDLVLPGTLSS